MRLLRYVDLFVAKGLTVSRVICLSTKKSVAALNILPPILVGCLWEYLKSKQNRGPVNWTATELAQHMRSWSDDLAPYAEFFEFEGIDGGRLLHLDRAGIRNLEILPKCLEETLLNHITNVRRLQADKIKAEIEKTPPKPALLFKKSHTFSGMSTKPQTPTAAKPFLPCLSLEDDNLVSGSINEYRRLTVPAWGYQSEPLPIRQSISKSCNNVRLIS
jgi:hypothetical protein